MKPVWRKVYWQGSFVVSAQWQWNLCGSKYTDMEYLQYNTVTVKPVWVKVYWQGLHVCKTLIKDVYALIQKCVQTSSTEYARCTLYRYRMCVDGRGGKCTPEYWKVMFVAMLVQSLTQTYKWKHFYSSMCILDHQNWNECATQNSGTGMNVQYRAVFFCVWNSIGFGMCAVQSALDLKGVQYKALELECVQCTLDLE